MSQSYSGLHVKCLIFSSILTIKVPSIKFHRNPSSDSHADAFGKTETQTDTQTDRQTDREMKGWTDMKKLTGVFHNYANMQENAYIYP